MKVEIASHQHKLEENRIIHKNLKEVERGQEIAFIRYLTCEGCQDNHNIF